MKRSNDRHRDPLPDAYLEQAQNVFSLLALVSQTSPSLHILPSLGSLLSKFLLVIMSVSDPRVSLKAPRVVANNVHNFLLS
jgi:hypothetical protein